MTLEEGLKALEGYRDQIDDLDRRILDLLNQRTQVVECIGQVKQELSLPVYEPKREDQVFENVRVNNKGPMTPDGAKRVFERIIDEMRNIQRVRILERDGKK